MTVSARFEINQATEMAVLEVMRAKKINKDTLKKAELGLKYEKQMALIELSKVNTAVNAASLYTPLEREKIAREIIPPQYDLIQPHDIVIGVKAQITGLFEELEAEKQKVHAVQERENDERARVQELEKEKQKLEDKLADIKDEKDAKDKPILQKLAQDEYQLKREATK